ncbi:MAG TPA: EAL domain-containing protein [Azospirillaceae bacterium]|nr:EAL domain-containing protein [Azospirillaceae bacterium]HRQ79486.1 EAL domain-containing protein [Azospirillaceae bacterium]
MSAAPPDAVPPADMLPFLLERLPDVFFRVDAAGRFTWASPNMFKLLGYQPEEMLGLPAMSLYVHPEERAKVVERIIDGAGAAVTMEVELRRKDGAAIWGQFSCCALFDAAGDYVGLQGVIRDVTELWRTRKTLEESEDRFRRLSDVAVEAICIHFQGKIIDFNKAFENLFRYSRDEFLQMWAWDVIHPDDAPLAMEKVRQHYEEAYEVRGVRKDGSVFPMEIHSKQSRMGDKSVRVTAIHDLTQRKQAERTVRLLSQAVEQSPVALAVVDAAGTVLYVNTAHRDVTGLTPESVVGKPLAALHPGPMVEELWRTLSQGQEWRGEIQISQQDGAQHWLQVYGSVVDDDDPLTPAAGRRHYVVLMEDVTIRKEQEKRLQHQAMFDALTDLPNRAYALDRLTYDILRAREVGRRVALLFVDLDEFKAINDSLGHEYGDELLVLASERLRRAAGGRGFVARFGGDEFLVIIGDLADAKPAEDVAAAIIREFAAPFAISRRELIATTSIGIAVYPDDGRTPQTLLRNADTAMYQAKVGGRNRARFFTPNMNEEAEARLRIESELRRAIDTDQLYLNYQPLVSVADGRVVGVEALLRWRSPELGQVPPDRFIPQAETSGLIVPIGRMVLRAACAAAKRWVDGGRPDLRICVNVSPRQFQDGGFVDDVRAALRESGLPARNLELEITEGLLLAERRDIERSLKDISALGAHLSIDDFGTGYSSLSYLERYTFDTLKIDRSFMIGMLERRERKVLVETIVSMASGLGLRVIAEGVETAEQLAHLAGIRCDVAQGYLFSRPVAETAVEVLLDTQFNVNCGGVSD